MWMKLSEIARYWAAKELTRTSWSETDLLLQAPFACPQFTVRLPSASHQPPHLVIARTRGSNSRRVSAPAQAAVRHLAERATNRA